MFGGIWEFLRQRTKQSVLAGFNDAITEAEGVHVVVTTDPSRQLEARTGNAVLALPASDLATGHRKLSRKQS